MTPILVGEFHFEKVKVIPHFVSPRICAYFAKLVHFYSGFYSGFLYPFIDADYFQSIDLEIFSQITFHLISLISADNSDSFLKPSTAYPIGDNWSTEPE